MATTTTITKLLFRRGNDADRKQTILASGEPGFALDTGRMWLGDGSTPGGIPIISAADHHLNYIDEYGNVEGNLSRQQLDVNVQGLSATLAGDREFPAYARTGKLFHPADRIVESQFPVHLTGDYDGTAQFSAGQTDDAVASTGTNLSLQYTGAKSKPFTIGRTNAGEINIGGVLKINTETQTISLNADGRFEISSEQQFFADASDTLFEDKSLDLNVPMQTGDGGLQQQIHYPDDLAKLATAESTGHYYAHMGVLSAGKVAMKNDRSQVGFNTVQIRPAAHDQHWAADVLMQNRLNGKLGVDLAQSFNDDPVHPMPRMAHQLNNVKSKQTGWKSGVQLQSETGNLLVHAGEAQYQCKNINLRSVRPQDDQDTFYSDKDTSVMVNMGGTKGNVNVASRAVDVERLWDGDVDLVFETGLIVYGPGDLSVQAQSPLNGYLINQSVDSLAIPTFQGINIEGPNSKPLQVPSGGTGRDEFTANRIIMSHPADGVEPFTELACNTGNVIGGQSGAPKQVSITSGNQQWLAKSHDGSGNISFKNIFAPNETTTPGHANYTAAPKQMFFDKFINILDDSNNKIVAGRFDAQLKIQGNNASNKIPDIITTQGTETTQGGVLENNAWAQKGPVASLKIDHYKFARLGAPGGTSSIYKKMNNPPSDHFFPTINSVTPTNNMTIESAAGGGYSLYAIEVNEGGHLMDWKSKDFDARYPQIFNMGSKSRRAAAQRRFSPGDVAVSRDVQSDNVGLSNTTTREANIIKNDSSDSSKAEYITDVEFNDYGTVHSVAIKDLTDQFFTKAQSNNRVRLISGMIDDVYSELDKRVHRYNNNTVSGDTGWINNAKIGLGPGPIPVAGLTYYDNNTLRLGSISGALNTNHQTNIYQHASGSGANNAMITFRVGADTSAADQMTINQHGIGFKPGSTGAVVATLNADGLVMTGYGRHGVAGAMGSGASDKMIYGTTTHSLVSDQVDVEEVGEFYNSDGSVRQDVRGQSGDAIVDTDPRSDYLNDPNHTLFPTFVIPVTHQNRDGQRSRSGYRHLLADNDLHYNPRENYFGNQDTSKIKFLGDGTGLDLSRNKTIPSSIELETRNTGRFNLVMCSSARDKIFDKNNLIQIDASAGHLYVSGDVIAYNNFSDKRLKKNITTLSSTESLNKVLQLSGVTFEWKDSPERGERVGLIAQQVEEIVPQVVTESPHPSNMDKTLKQVDYQALVPLLIESIKSQNDMICALETKVEHLINKLEER